MSEIDVSKVTSRIAINQAIDTLTERMGKMTVDEANARVRRATVWVEIAKELREQGR